MGMNKTYPIIKGGRYCGYEISAEFPLSKYDVDAVFNKMQECWANKTLFDIYGVQTEIKSVSRFLDTFTISFAPPNFYGEDKIMKTPFRKFIKQFIKQFKNE